MLASNLCKLIDSTKPFKTFVNKINNWLTAAPASVNSERSDGPDKAAIALADERAPAFKGPNNAALAASMLAYEPAPAFNCCTNYS